MSPFDMEWIVLFGGAKREKIVFYLLNLNLKIKCILVPIKQSKELAHSVSLIRESGVLIIESCRETLEESLKPYSGMALLSIGFPYILPESIISLFPLALNVHPTLLPSYKGPTSGAYILINNEKKTGSTVHFLEPEADAGDIILQSEVDLTIFDTVRSMQKKVYKTEPELVVESFKKMERGDPVLTKSEENSSFFRKRTPNDSLIDPNRSLLDLFNEIRACDPEKYPAFFYVEGQKVCVKLWRPERPAGEDEESL